jgi:hypothetical protein
MSNTFEQGGLNPSWNQNSFKLWILKDSSLVIVLHKLFDIVIDMMF